MKSSIIVSNFLLIMAAARVLDTEHFGIYSILFSAVGLFCIVATFGQQVSVMRWWNEYTAADDPALLKGALRFSFATCLAGCADRGGRFLLLGSLQPRDDAGAAVTLYHGRAGLGADHGAPRAHGGRRRRGRWLRQSARRAAGAFYLAFCLATGTAADVSTVFFLFSGGAIAAMLLHFVFIAARIQPSIPTLPPSHPRHRPARAGGRARSSCGSPTAWRPRTSISTC